jgi:molybdenum cofactor biosynthesis enzyme MoaA
MAYLRSKVKHFEPGFKNVRVSMIRTGIPMPEKDLNELVKSIKEEGLKTIFSINRNGYLLANRRLFEAAKKAGLKRVPVNVR